MKIFNESRSTVTTTTQTPVLKRSGKKAVSTKEPISDKEIRAKLAASTEISEAAKNKAKVEGKRMGEGFMKPVENPINTEDHLLKADVQVNDPKDPVTAEKLKTILDTGAFSFNPKERDVLSKILAEN